MAAVKEIQINKEWCKACAICIKSCPKKVYTPDSDGKPDVTDLSSCIGCGICESRCPDMAITIVGE